MIAVGTTSCRTLEAVAAKYGEIRACSGNTSIFLYPGVKFNCIDGLVTNFHLPESTLIMLIAALYGYDKTMHAYKVAVEEKYRFFSFGDAMFTIYGTISTLKISLIGISLRSVIWITPPTASMRLTSPVTVW